MDEEFYINLNVNQKNIYNRYKGNTESFCYTLNARLRSGDHLTDINDILILEEIIFLYQTPDEIVLHRATVEADVNNFIVDRIYTNPEFLSASTDLESVQQHFTNANNPVYMIITCPIGMYMAPMQGNIQYGDTENEMLLARNNNFEIINDRLSSNRLEIEEIMGRDFAQGVENLRIIELQALL